MLIGSFSVTGKLENVQEVGDAGSSEDSFIHNSVRNSPLKAKNCESIIGITYSFPQIDVDHYPAK